MPGWRPGIRARLFLLALVTLSPLVGVLIFQDYYHLVAARQRADADATRLAQMKAGDVDQNLLAIETQLAALRAVIAADRAQISANEAALTLLLNDLPAAIDGIAAFAVDGGALGAAWRDDIGRADPRRRARGSGRRYRGPPSPRRRAAAPGRRPVVRAPSSPRGR